MFRPGLVSITFRQLSPAEVCQAAADAQLEGIEWGGDVHVPPGQPTTAKEVAAMTADHGLTVAAYGSYYRAGQADPDAFAGVLDSARALGAPLIRVWCGQQGSAEIDPSDRAQVTADCRRIAELTHDAGLTIACEWHGNTLTDTAASAAQLFDDVDHPAFKTYWQPRTGAPPALSIEDMDAALARMVGLHVFQWAASDPMDRRPLAEGEAVWPGYLDKAKACPAAVKGEDVFALLEFVRDDDPANLPADAETLRRWLNAANA